MNNSNFVLPDLLIKTLDQLPFPLIIREKETTKYSYANLPAATLFGLKSTKLIIDKIDSEIPSSVCEDETITNMWQEQVRYVSNTFKQLTVLEVHPNELASPYITISFLFYDDNNKCIGAACSAKYLEVFTPNDFVRGKLPGSLLLTKPDNFFTEKECEVIFLKLQKMTSKVIATILNRSHRTVENIIQRLYEKAGVSHSTDFTEFCERRDLHRYLPSRFLSGKITGIAEKCF